MSEGRTRAEPAVPDVFVYADYACPYSYIGVRRLELLAEERALALHWRPLPPASGASLAAVAASREPGVARDLMRQASELGLPLALPGAPVLTREAHQAAELARDLGPSVFRRTREALFYACLAEGRDIGDRAVLLAVAERAGVDRSALAAALEDGRYEEELDVARAEADRYGIEATPTFLFGRFMLVGAAPLEELRRAADRAAAEGRSG